MIDWGITFEQCSYNCNWILSLSIYESFLHILSIHLLFRILNCDSSLNYKLAAFLMRQPASCTWPHMTLQGLAPSFSCSLLRSDQGFHSWSIFRHLSFLSSWMTLSLLPQIGEICDQSFNQHWISCRSSCESAWRSGLHFPLASAHIFLHQCLPWKTHHCHWLAVC